MYRKYVQKLVKLHSFCLKWWLSHVQELFWKNKTTRIQHCLSYSFFELKEFVIVTMKEKVELNSFLSFFLSVMFYRYLSNCIFVRFFWMCRCRCMYDICSFTVEDPKG